MLTKKQYKSFVSQLLGLECFLNGKNILLNKNKIKNIDKNYLISVCDKKTKKDLYYIIIDNDDYTNNTYKTSEGKTFDTNELIKSFPNGMGDAIFYSIKLYK